MATHPKQKQQRMVAEARLVAALARKHFAGFTAADAQRKRKFLPESRLLAFEGAIAHLEGAIGGRRVAAHHQFGATVAEGALRSRLYDVLRELREEVKLGVPERPAVGRVFGVGARMSRNSTPRVLRVALGVLAAWEKEEYREAVANIGITRARMAEVRELTEGLGKARAEQDGMCGAARGQTMVKDAQLGKVYRELVYVRRVARLVFRQQPAVLAEFAGTMRRGRRRARVARVQEGEGEVRGAMARGARGSSRGRRGGVKGPRGAAQAQRGEGGSRRGQEGSSRRQEVPSPRQEAPFAGQGGSSLRQGGASARQEGSSLGQEVSFPMKEGSFLRHGASSGRVKAATPRTKRRRRR